MTSSESDEKSGSGTLISEMVISGEEKTLPRADLIVEPEQDADSRQFDEQVEKTLKETEQAVIDIQTLSLMPDRARSWQLARKLIEDFKPVPWFIWRLTNFVMGKPGHSVDSVPEGLVLGLRRLLFAAASDAALGTGGKVNSVRRALEILPAEVVSAVAVIHAISRRLSSRQFERIWRPMLDDALVRARLGFIIGRRNPQFGGGRGMLAGFSGRSGLTILIASGELEQARQALEMLAAGEEISEVGMDIYGCDPLQVSAMVLSASGCGRDASFGVASYSVATEGNAIEDESQRHWLAAFCIVEKLRMGKPEEITPEFLELFGLARQSDMGTVNEEIKLILRRGHGWNWLV